MSNLIMKVEHRMFLQGILCEKILNYEEVKDLYEKSLRHDSQEININIEDIVPFIRVINTNIEPFHMAIVKCTSERDGRDFYALVNRQECAITRLSSRYTSLELQLFQKLVKAVVESEVGYIKSTAFLNLTDSLTKSLGKTAAQEFLDRLEDDKWVVQKHGKVYLSTLAITELDQYIKREHSDFITNCKLCKQLVLQGESCSTCDLKLHFHCVKRFCKNKNAKCPQCDNIWQMSSQTESQSRSSRSTPR